MTVCGYLKEWRIVCDWDEIIEKVFELLPYTHWCDMKSNNNTFNKESRKNIIIFRLLARQLIVRHIIIIQNFKLF